MRAHTKPKLSAVVHSQAFFLTPHARRYSRAYAAPEVLQYVAHARQGFDAFKLITRGVDVYALGCLTWEVATLSPPPLRFRQNRQVLHFCSRSAASRCRSWLHSSC